MDIVIKIVKLYVCFLISAIVNFIYLDAVSKFYGGYDKLVGANTPIIFLLLLSFTCLLYGVYEIISKKECVFNGGVFIGFILEIASVILLITSLISIFNGAEVTFTLFYLLNMFIGLFTILTCNTKSFIIKDKKKGL